MTALILSDQNENAKLQDFIAKLKIPPGFGEYLLPQSYTFAGRYAGAGRMYLTADEALRDSPTNARYMRNDTLVSECIESRQRSTALLGWHLDPEDQEDPAQVDLCRELTAIIEATPNFMAFRYSLLSAIWYGRAANQWQYEKKKIRGKYRDVVKAWLPVHGDKLVFPLDGQDEFEPGTVGIRLYGAADKDQIHGFEADKLVATSQGGMAYLLDEDERRALCVHKHIIEDGDYNDPQSAGSVHGVGIRSRIYAEWYQKQEVAAWMMDYLERSGQGIQIWPFMAGNKDSEDAVKRAQRECADAGRTALFVPITPGEIGLEDWRPQIIEPGPSGAAALQGVLERYFGHRIKRYILGQTLTSEAEATGMGSGVADAHMATYADIVRFDARNLEESITVGLVEPLKFYNFPAAIGCQVRFKIDTEIDQPEKKLEAINVAFGMGLRIKADDVYNLLGLSKPEEGDEVLSAGDLAQATAPMMGPMLGNQPPSPKVDAQAELERQLRAVEQEVLAG